MPCYQVNKVSVQFGGQSLLLLKAAARELGFRYGLSGDVVMIGGVRIDTSKGIATGEQGMINRVKQAYSREAVKLAAKRNGWTVSVKGQNKMTINKW